MTQGANVVRIHFLWRFLSALFHLCAKTALLIERIVQLGKTVGEFLAGDEEFKAFG